MVAGRPAVRYQVAITFLSVAMVTVALTSLAAFWRVTVPVTALMQFSLTAVGAAWVWWRWPWVGFGLLVAGLFASAAAFYLVPEWVRWVSIVMRDAGEFGDNLARMQFESSFSPRLALVFLGLFAAGLGFLTTTEALARGSAFWSVTVGTLIFGTEWVWFFDRSVGHFTTYAVAGFALWVLGQAGRRDALWAKSGRRIGYPSHITTPLAFVVLLAFVSTLMPINFEPPDLGRVGEQIQEAFPMLKRLRGAGGPGGDGRFSLRATGFSPVMGTLGGKVSLDNRVALQVTPERPITSTLYLRGATFQVYTGQTWLPGGTDDVTVSDGGYLPNNLGLEVLREDMTMKVSHSLNLGNTLFHPLEAARVEGVKSDIKADSDGNLWASRTVARNTPYTISARVPIYSAQQIRQLSSWGVPETMKPYLLLPGRIPPRVGELTERLTTGTQHPYDAAVAIERYLRSFAYDLDVPAAPSGRDFVDYFLFDLKRGYCVYSATAMTVMLRMAGVPARLVEGFALPISATSTVDASGKRTYPVINSQAHAWVEAYFHGYGWVTFDPTPRSDLPIIDRSTAAPQFSGDNSATTTSTPSGGEDVPEDPQDISEAGGGTAAAAESNNWVWGLLAMVPILALFVYAFRRLKSQEAIVAAHTNEVVQVAWVKGYSLLSLFGLGRKPGQTAKEYAQTLGTMWPAIADTASEVAQDYTVARYAQPDRPLDPEAPGRARQLWARLNELLFERVGWRRYLWRRLRWTPKEHE